MCGIDVLKNINIIYDDDEIHLKLKAQSDVLIPICPEQCSVVSRACCVVNFFQQQSILIKMFVTIDKCPKHDILTMWNCE